MTDELTVPDEAEVARREDAIIRALHGDHWIPPLSDAIGSELAIRVLARALAPFWANVPRFNWAGSGSIGSVEFPNYSTYNPGTPGQQLSTLETIMLSVPYTGGRFANLEQPAIVVGIDRTELPHRAEVFVHIEDLKAEGEQPVVVDRTCIDVASPGGCTMYTEPVPGHTPRPIPRFAPAETSTVDAAVDMGKILANRLAHHYQLEPQS